MKGDNIESREFGPQMATGVCIRISDLGLSSSSSILLLASQMLLYIMIHPSPDALACTRCKYSHLLPNNNSSIYKDELILFNALLLLTHTTIGQ